MAKHKRKWESPHPARTATIKIVDTVTHQLTGVQVLWHLLQHWAVEGQSATILEVESGRVESMMNTVRVALHRERASRNLPRTFELRNSDGVIVEHKTYNSKSNPCPIKCQLFVIAKVHGHKTTQMAAAFQAIMAESNGEQYDK